VRSSVLHDMVSIRAIFSFILVLKAILCLTGCSSPVSQTLEPAQSDIGKASTNSETKNKSYPDWFWNMPRSEDTLFAVGFCETSTYHIENSEQRAIDEGLANLARCVSVHIKAEGRRIGGAGGNITPDIDIQEEVFAETETFVKEHHQVVAKFISPEHTIVLLRSGEKDESTPVLSTGSTELPPEPSWVAKLPEEPGYIYATGGANLYYREIDSWRRAERIARAALAFTIEAKVKGLIQRFDDQMLSISIVNTDVQLNNVQVVARWKSRELNTCHVLARVKEPR